MGRWQCDNCEGICRKPLLYKSKQIRIKLPVWVCSSCGHVDYSRLGKYVWDKAGYYGNTYENFEDAAERVLTDAYNEG